MALSSLHIIWLFQAVVALQVDASKVTSIKTSILEKSPKSTGGKAVLFVEITAGDIVGWGQCGYNNEHADIIESIADKVHEWIGPLVLGKEFETPEDIDALAEKAWEKNYKHTGTVLAQALAGIDTALWDIIAKRRNMSVCSLIAESLGSVCHKSMPVYGSNGDRSKSPEDIVANAVANHNKYGVKAFKFQIANRMGNDKDIKPGRTEELIPLARKELGPDVKLMVDANGGYKNYTHALSIAQLLIENNYTWFEEPFPYWQYDQVAKLSKEVEPKGLGIACGEQEFRLDVFEQNIHAMRYAQPDIHYVGGLSRSLRVARMTMAAKTTFVPHSPNPSGLDVMALHMLAAVPNAFGFMEFDAVNTRNPPSGSDYFVEHAYELKDGAMVVPQGPGWGVALKPGLLEKATNKTSSKSEVAVVV